MTAMNVRSISRSARTAVPAADTLSVPLTRLFDERDIEFLRTVPGYSIGMEIEFRRRRCRIFRGYLRSLRAEFLAARAGMETLRIESPQDYQQLALIMLRCRLRFAWAMIPASLCLFRYRWELGNPSLVPVVQRFEAILDEIQRSIPEVS